MKRVLVGIAMMTALVTGLWLFAEPSLLSSSLIFQWRSALIQYSGIVAIMLMSLTMVLALRLDWVEQVTQGLDKSYRLHKWTGIAGGVLAIIHWLFYHLPIQLVSAGILTAPQRFSGRGPAHLGNDLLSSWILELRSTGLALGEWGFYLLIALIALSLWTALRYRPFRVSHKLMAVAYLMVAAHSALLLKHSYWGTPIYFLTMAFIVIGVLAALYSLLGLIGRYHQYDARISRVQYHPLSRILDLELHMPTSWPGHRCGQYAYLQFGHEDPHPFTLVSGCKGDKVRFLIKELGDFTTGLNQRVNLGDSVRVEGPYGHFSLHQSSPQIWIAGGVGVAPFVAALHGYAEQPPRYPVFFFFSCRGVDTAILQELHQLATRSGVTLEIVDTRYQPRLTIEGLAQRFVHLDHYDVYFCGPESMSAQLKNDLKRHRFDTAHHYHEEMYAMR